MIDVELDVFSTIKTAIETVYSDIYVTSVYVPTPAKLPAVSIIERDNSVYERSRDSRAIENAAHVMYEVNVYSNKVGGRKKEAKGIAATVDSAFAALGFTRSFKDEIPNEKDATIYRIVMRYEAIVEADSTTAYFYHSNT